MGVNSRKDSYPPRFCPPHNSEHQNEISSEEIWNLAGGKSVSTSDLVMLFEKTDELPSKSNLPADQLVLKPKRTEVVPSIQKTLHQITFAVRDRGWARTHTHIPKNMRSMFFWSSGGPGIVRGRKAGGDGPS